MGKWPYCKKVYKYKSCGSKDYGQASCIKGKKQVWGGDIKGNGLKEYVVGIFDIAMLIKPNF